MRAINGNHRLSEIGIDGLVSAPRSRTLSPVRREVRARRSNKTPKGGLMKRAVPWLMAAFITLLAIPAVFAALRRNPATSDTIRRFNRDTLNPWMLDHAGKGDWYASTIQTKGRKTGSVHRTPVLADPVEGGFMIPLPYGTNVDWLKNARAAGEATIRYHDRDYALEDFEIIDGEEALGMLPSGHRFNFRVHRIDKFLSAKIAHDSPVPVH
jgi:hypothetical protein